MTADGNMTERGYSIVLCGEAGQGIQSVEHLLTRVLKRSGYHVFATKEYMSRVRGGVNSTEIRVSSEPVAAFVDRIDILVPLGPGAVSWVAERLDSRTVVLGDRESVGAGLEGTGARLVDLPLSGMAAELGGAVYATTAAAGAVASLFCVDRGVAEEYLRGRYAGKGDKVVEANLRALELGYRRGSAIREGGMLTCDLQADPSLAGAMLLNGGEAVGLGALAGGCDFMASYPMTPSTPVLVFLAQQAREFGVIVEQAEDEISAINMALGAWYAGARGMVTTSGGGFDLMTEGLSLAGMHESPLVVHLGQRPGPATGLPTRTEQGDLELVLHAGHGDVPRIVLAPGTVEQAFDLTRRAFDLADRFQVPVIILTDQDLVDSYYDLPALETGAAVPERHVTTTDETYRRYRVTPDGVSPRGVPGRGAGLVVAGSDEHEEDGHITESRAVRKAMVEKRLRKREAVLRAAIPPEYIGWKPPHDSYRSRIASNLIVCWGSTYHAVREARERLGREDVGLIHCSQVFPIHPDVFDYLRQASRVIFIEGNATGQFARLVRAYTGWKAAERPPSGGKRSPGAGEPGPQIQELILNYDGHPFSVERVTDRLREVLK